MPPHMVNGDDDVPTPNSIKVFRKTRRHVTFSKENDSVILVPHVKDMEYDEIQSLWWEKKDLDGNKNEIMAILRKMMKGQKIDENNKQTTRGLEYRTRQGALKRQHNKFYATLAVMEEQERQFYSEGRDEELIRDAYRTVTSVCQEEAYELALQDEQEVKEDLEKAKLGGRWGTRSVSRQLSGDATSGLQRMSNLLKQVGMKRHPLPENSVQKQATRVMGPAA